MAEHEREKDMVDARDRPARDFPGERAGDLGAGAGPPPADSSNHPASPPDLSSNEHQVKPSAVDLVIANANAPFPQTLSSIAEEYGYKASYLRTLAYNLRQSGILPPLSAYQRQLAGKRGTHGIVAANVAKREAQERRKAEVPTKPEKHLATGRKKDSERKAIAREQAAVQQLEDLQGRSDLTPEQRRQVLAVLATTGQQQVMVAAVKALEDMDRQQGRQVGPPPPMTREDRINRAVRFLEALGREDTNAAIAQVEPLWADVEAVDRGVRLDPGGGGDVGQAGRGAEAGGPDAGDGGRLEEEGGDRPDAGLGGDPDGLAGGGAGDLGRAGDAGRVVRGRGAAGGDDDALPPAGD